MIRRTFRRSSALLLLVLLSSWLPTAPSLAPTLVDAAPVTSVLADPPPATTPPGPYVAGVPASQALVYRQQYGGRQGFPAFDGSFTTLSTETPLNTSASLSFSGFTGTVPPGALKYVQTTRILPPGIHRTLFFDVTVESARVDGPTDPTARATSLIAVDFRTYSDPLLLNQADIVVAVAPDPRVPVEEGVRHFIKPGGRVEIITEHQGAAARLETAFTGRVLPLRNLRSRGTSGDYTVIGHLGVPLTSAHFAQDAWELYVPSW